MADDLLTDAVWACAASAPGAVTDPAGLPAAGLRWRAATVPGTTAGALRSAGAWAPGEERDLDAEDWWFRGTFAGPAGHDSWELVIGGIATLADVWLNGRHLLRSENMFRRYRLEVGDGLEPVNELVIRCEALGPRLGERRPRPSWKAPLVSHQNLRWYRTSLLGRAPGWTASVAPVGPWQPIELRQPERHRMLDQRLSTAHDGTVGRLDAEFVFARDGVDQPAVELEIDGRRHGLAVTIDGDEIVARGTVTLTDVAAWWPATHGAQPRYPLAVRVTSDATDQTRQLGRVGFRSVSFGPAEAPAIEVNGQAVFARGVCWTPMDPVTLQPAADELRAFLEQLRAGGINLIRIPGTTIYGSSTLLDLCDELGILVWQDLMFANLDYPVGDAAFAQQVEAEVREQLARLQAHPSVVAVCGGSEVTQQATMMGRPLGTLRPPPLEQRLAELAAEVAPHLAFWPNSPWGGDLPISVDQGLAHYFGVGGYRRPLTDARTCGVRFASECLAFSAVPGDDTVRELAAAGTTVGSAAWKAGVPRDHGRAWDHEDVRDHYVRHLLGLDPTEVRAVDAGRYLDLGRAAVAEAMARTMAEWRRDGSPCAGAIILQARDVVDGAGVGLFDHRGRPKSPWYALARTLAPAALLASDEGLNGLDLHAVNDSPDPVGTDLVVRAFAGTHCVAEASVACTVAPRSQQRLRVEALLGEFLDVTYAYRFGPRQIDTVAARWYDGDALVSRIVFQPDGTPYDGPPPGLSGTSRALGDGCYELRISTEQTARCVLIGAPGAELSDDAFDLEPGGTAVVTARSARPTRFEVRAANGPRPITLEPVDG